MTMSNNIQRAIDKLKEKILDRYRERLSQIILFGSRARNDAEPESDIDILIVLKGEVNPVAEIKSNNDWLSELCLETDELINCIYLSETQFKTKNTSLLRNIRREGILI